MNPVFDTYSKGLSAACRSHRVSKYSRCQTASNRRKPSTVFAYKPDAQVQTLLHSATTAGKPRPLAVAVPTIEDYRTPRALRFLATQHISTSPPRKTVRAARFAAGLRRPALRSLRRRCAGSASAARETCGLSLFTRAGVAVQSARTATATTTVRELPSSNRQPRRVRRFSTASARYPLPRTRCSRAGWGFLGVPSGVASDDSCVRL